MKYKKILKILFKILFTTFILFLILAFPIFTGFIVSFSVWPDLETSNDWIGFWGGYAGAIVGGIITLLVMRKTLDSNLESQKHNDRRQLCNHVAKLVSDFCIEMMAYRSKLKTLSKQYSGRAIPPEKKIEMGATTEKPKRIFFEMEMLLADIPSAKNVLEYMSMLLNEENIVNRSMRQTEVLLEELRKRSKEFIQSYISE